MRIDFNFLLASNNHINYLKHLITYYLIYSYSNSPYFLTYNFLTTVTKVIYANIVTPSPTKYIPGILYIPKIVPNGVYGMIVPIKIAILVKAITIPELCFV